MKLTPKTLLSIFLCIILLMVIGMLLVNNKKVHTCYKQQIFWLEKIDQNWKDLRWVDQTLQDRYELGLTQNKDYDNLIEQKDNLLAEDEHLHEIINNLCK